VKDGNLWVQSGATAKQLTTTALDSMPTWSAVMNPDQPEESLSTLAIGTTQLVVQDAAETMSCRCGRTRRR
jgi:hypothetical protein